MRKMGHTGTGLRQGQQDVVTTDPGNVAVTLDGVGKVFGRGTTRPVIALSGISLEVREGEFVSIIGPSGCGKSTLLRIIAGLERATVGSVHVGTKPVVQPQTQVGLVFQAPTLLAWRSVLDNVLIQAEAKHVPRNKAAAAAEEALARVGLTNFADKLPRQLSGGMQQRVAIARALLLEPKLILMDEPFGALDAITREKMGDDLGEIRARMDSTFIFITHSIAEAVYLSDRIIVMSTHPGSMVADVPVDLPRPRTRSIRDTEPFNELTRQLRELLERTATAR